jgi:hypothetical protein
MQCIITASVSCRIVRIVSFTRFTWNTTFNMSPTKKCIYSWKIILAMTIIVKISEMRVHMKLIFKKHRYKANI